MNVHELLNKEIFIGVCLYVCVNDLQEFLRKWEQRWAISNLIGQAN